MVHFFKYITDVIDRIGKNTASIDNNKYAEWAFNIIGGSYITIAHCHHCDNWKIERIDISIEKLNG